MRLTAPTTALVLLTGTAPASPEITTEYGIEFVTVSDVNNPAYSDGGDPAPWNNNGRGSVSYEYRIATREVRTEEFLEFVNLARSVGLGTHIGTIGNNLTWGASFDFFGNSYVLPDGPSRAADSSVLGVSWHQAAMYINWLHNDKAPTLEAMMNGAYDVSTFGFDENGVRTDQAARNADARFFIPSCDEQLKAFYYDPNKNGQGPGWWEYVNSSDQPPIPDLLKNGGTTSAGLADFIPPDFGNLTDEEIAAWPYSPANLSVGMYPDQQSPWGLLDTSGGATEWTEDYALTSFGERSNSRHVAGTNIFDPFNFIVGEEFFPGLDAARGLFSFDNPVAPEFRRGHGLRIAAAVPGPSAVALFAVLSLINSRLVPDYRAAEVGE